MPNDRIASRDLAMGIIFLSQSVLGILGNFSLLYHYLSPYYTKGRLKSTDLILKHLTIANSLVILSTGVPQTLAVWGLKHFFDDFGCKLLLYVQRVGRGMSIGTTCLLSVFQTIVISPINSRWKALKIKSPKYIDRIIHYYWILYIVANFIFPVYAVVKWNSKNITQKRDFGYCSSIGHDKIVDLLYAALLVFPEVLFSVLTILSSGSLIFILYRHKQQVQHLHRTNMSYKFSPEWRATKSILVLVSTFVTFHTFSSVFYAGIGVFYNLSWWSVNSGALMSVCFPTVSPFVLMSRDSTIFRLCFFWVKNRKFSNLILKM
ncbi:vomeronasal type-1 receptor 4-like [Otolemur garnettii]|uniref:vomeronasal type-1 receptor 4-like n=1 Tax=Otolemur garnettii TaxID=30611 RepID=UPI000C7F108C|nr:vomeronasal type-1 receptor 4-like [Otolemur garnettii]